ncbi:MAG: response regulator, partial [Deltaproteobacteria bacterium]|nr:response regulator [Deltaproteobacteria bacterium]
MDALEMAASLGDFQSSINNLRDTSVILKETGSRIQSLIRLEAIAFFLVNNDTNNFDLVYIDPHKLKSHIYHEVDFLIENETFAWALREKRPVIVSSKQYDKQLILHGMATSSRIKGMFIGLLEKDKTDIPDISLSLLSIILLNSSNALESNELYKMIREINNNLEKKENYRILFDAAPDGVEVLDAKGNIVDCNKAHEMLLKENRNVIIGNHTTNFFSEQSRTLFEEKFLVLRETGYAEGEIELIRKKKSTIPVWRKEKAIYNEDGAFVGSVIYNRDISRHKEIERERKKLEEQILRFQKMEALGTLAGGVAHDLNNVLAGLVSYPELLLMQIPEQSPLRKSILTIQKSGEKAAAIVQDLLTLARRGVAVTETVNLNQIISDHFNTPEHEQLQFFHPGVEFETHLDKELLNIMGSPVHLSKTVMNLLSNAAEAMSDGGSIIITTSNEYIDRPIKGYDHVREGDYVTLTVYDTGTGISSEDMEKIFEPFYTKKKMGRSGTGLGMAVVWGTVKDHKGYINIESTKGKGTVFKLYFPVTRKGLVESKTASSAQDYMGGGESILVVDDIEEQRDIAAMMLTKLGYTVTTVSSGEEAVEYMKDHSAELLILDMIMDSDMDGLETYKKIIELHPGQKAIIVSGFSETESVKEAQRMGAGTYVKKPYLFEKIGMAVREALD